jgi:hypothetical protein
MTYIELRDQKEKLMRVLQDRGVTAKVSVKGNTINITSMSKPDYLKENPLTKKQRIDLKNWLENYYNNYLPNIVFSIKEE